jgi:hypothetical protein
VVINLSDYKDYPYVKVTNTDGEEFVGYVIALETAEDAFENGDPNPEDGIDVELDNGLIYGFCATDISRIEILGSHMIAPQPELIVTEEQSRALSALALESIARRDIAG